MIATAYERTRNSDCKRLPELRLRSRTTIATIVTIVQIAGRFSAIVPQDRTDHETRFLFSPVYLLYMHV